MKAGIFLSVREKAKRLPGKVLLPLGGCRVTEYLLRSLSRSKRAEEIVVATSIDPRDEVLCDIAISEGVSCFRGSEDDKLVRYRDAVRQFGLDFVVVVDGDDPFVSVEHIDRIIDHAESRPVDYVVCDGLPVGATGFGFRSDALERICVTKTESNTEVWGRFFSENPEFECLSLQETDPLYNRPEIRMTLDYEEDYKFFTTVIDGINPTGEIASFAEVMSFVTDNPEVININREAQIAYERHLQSSMS